MKHHLSTLALFLIFFLGLSLLLYPAFSDWWNSFHQSQAIVNYDAALANMTPADYTTLFAAAQRYNQALAQIDYPLMDHHQAPGYQEALNVSGNGVMGYLQIPKIQVSLPIYHGASESVLQVAVGHLEGTSLPIGGESTHSALSAHRGLPSARLFTDLDKLEPGDTFTVTVLDRELTYEVDQILVVEPQEVEELYVVEGEDLCTLITCTPYGINTHRMLVRGHRVQPSEEARVIRVTADGAQVDPVFAAPFLAAPVLALLLFFSLIPKRRNGT